MKRLPRGLRKYIRKEKARVRREFLGEAQRSETLKIIFEAIKGYAHENASRMPLLKVSIINPQKPLRDIQLASVTQNFNYFNFFLFLMTTLEET